MKKYTKNKIKVFLAAPTLSSPERREVVERVRACLIELDCEITYDWVGDNLEYSPKELVKKTLDGIIRADILVAEVTFPSIGVGQQIAMAIERKIPVIALHADWKYGANRFLAGSEGELLRFYRYSPEKLSSILKEGFKVLYKQRLVKFNFISTPDINSDLDRLSVKMGISKSQLVRIIIREWKRNNQD